MSHPQAQRGAAAGRQGPAPGSGHSRPRRRRAAGSLAAPTIADEDANHAQRLTKTAHSSTPYPRTAVTSIVTPR